MAVEKRLSNPNAMTTREMSGNDRAKALELLAMCKEREAKKEEEKRKKMEMANAKDQE